VLVSRWRHYLLLHLLWIMKAHHPPLLAGCQGLLRAGRLRECSYPRCIELKWDPLSTQTGSWLRHADATRQSAHTLTQTCTQTHSELHSQNQCSERKGSFFRTLMVKLLIWSKGTNFSVPPWKHSEIFLIQRPAASNHFMRRNNTVLLTNIIRSALVLNKHIRLKCFWKKS